METKLKSLSTIPKLPGWPWVGVLPQFYWQQWDFLLAAHRTYGDIFRMDLGKTELVILAHPDYAHHVLVDNGQNYRTKGGAVGFRVSSIPLAGDGVTTTAQPEDWRRQRRAVQPFFHKHYLTQLAPAMGDVIAEQLTQWDELATTAQPLDLAAEMQRIAMCAVVKMVYGVPIEAEAALKLAHAIEAALDYLWQGTINECLPTWSPKPGLARCQKAIHQVNDMVDQLIEQALQASADEGNLIKRLRKQDPELTPKQLREEGVTMLVGATESLPAMLGWLFHLLLQHPQTMATLQDELAMQPAGTTQPLPAASLPALPFARMVVQETLRLYSPVYWLQRMATEADEIGAFQIPAGTIVVVLSHLIHHHPVIWPEPHVFRPDRFSEQAMAERHKAAWIPFGAGHRVCAALEHSLLIGQLVLSQVLQRYDLMALPNRKTSVTIGTSTRPHGGVWARLQKRNSQ